MFQLLVTSLLLSAPIPAENACSATRALLRARLTTPRKMAEASWQRRVDIITWNGYKRYDESASSMLGDAATLALERYRGDLRQLHAKNAPDVSKISAALQEFHGIGPVGADIFLREVQAVWSRVYPYADERVLASARALGLGEEVSDLAKLVTRWEFPRLCSGLVRVALAKEHDAVLERAG